jgi:hypothetical protein
MTDLGQRFDRVFPRHYRPAFYKVNSYVYIINNIVNYKSLAKTARAPHLCRNDHWLNGLRRTGCGEIHSASTTCSGPFANSLATCRHPAAPVDNVGMLHELRYAPVAPAAASISARVWRSGVVGRQPVAALSRASEP